MRALVCAVAVLLTGCSTLTYLAHVWSPAAPAARTHRFADGGSAVYYAFSHGGSATPDTAVFFYGGSGCTSWKYVMPGYIAGLALRAEIYVLNKRHVGDRAHGRFGCSTAFHEDNTPARWLHDYREFIQARLADYRQQFGQSPRRVLLVGVSEGGLPAVQLAASLPVVTHVALIGDGSFSMRDNLATLERRGVWPAGVLEQGLQQLQRDPMSLEHQWLGHPHRYWHEMLDLQPLPWWLRVEQPILLGIGSADHSVPVESALAARDAFARAGKHNLTLLIYEGADHRLQRGEHDHRHEFFDSVGRWLQSGTPH